MAALAVMLFFHCLTLGLGLGILQAARPSIITVTAEPSGTPVDLPLALIRPRSLFPARKHGTNLGLPAQVMQTQVRATEGLPRRPPRAPPQMPSTRPSQSNHGPRQGIFAPGTSPAD